MGGLGRWARSKGIVEQRLPATRQSTNWTCGPAALRSALAWLGVESTEQQLVKLTGANAKDGTPPEGLAEAARALGLQAQVSHGLTLAGLDSLRAEGKVAIVALQAWGDGDYANGWEDGHYVVPIARAGGQITLADPSADARSVVSDEEFLKRWHDREAKGIYVRSAVIVWGGTPGAREGGSEKRAPLG